MADNEITEMQTFRLPVSLIDHLDRAKKESDFSKTVIVKRALTEYLAKHFPASANQAAMAH